jgi:hypothetical protein
MICSGWLRHRPRDSDRCSGDEAETLFDRVPIGSLFARENSLFFAENSLLWLTAVRQF